MLSKLSPLALPVEQAHDAMILGRPVDWGAFAVNLVVSLAILYGGSRRRAAASVAVCARAIGSVFRARLGK